MRQPTDSMARAIHRLSVLVIEGDPNVARLFSEVFSQQGWLVRAPSDGPGVAGELLGNHYYDIITVSYRFSSLNGADLIKLIRELEHRKDTPVLMVTGGADVTVEALAAGATEVLYKPVEPRGLVAAVMRHTASSIAS